ncbi:MAG: NADP-dependent oxidoreductase, partial [Gammaproteobacteria bacterium]|nr:NADP-dependent oxidoreductase [Gammaproteobacteria bacterium]
MKNRKVVLTGRPEGQITASNMSLVEEDVGELGDGMVLVQVEHLSIDAFIRTTFDEAAFHGTA